MRYFKDENNKIFAFDDNQDELAVAADQQGLVEITESEKDALLTPSMATVLKLKIAEINRDCKAAIEGGFVSNALGQDYTYDSELEDQVNISGNVQMGIDVLHKCIDGNGDAAYVTHSAAEMRLVGEHLVAHKLAQLTKAGGLKVQAAAAAAADDLASLQAITWS
ncbi:MAG: hypothetical protein ACRBB4_01375 [Neptuniibacter sp.]